MVKDFARIIKNQSFFFLFLKVSHLFLHHVPKDVGSMNKISPSVPILSIPLSLEEGAASNDIIFPSLPWSSLSVGTRDHFHKNAFRKPHVAHSAYNSTTVPNQILILFLSSWDNLLKDAYIISHKGVRNFEIDHKTSSIFG